MRSKRFAFILCLLLSLVCIYLSQAQASDWKLLELKDATIEYKSFFAGGYRPTLNGNGLENRQPGKEVILYLHTDIARYFFFNNRIHGGTDEMKDTGAAGQFRDVGWNFQFGVRPSKYVTLQYEHHSQHMLDYASPNRFPVEDSIGFQLHILRDARPSATVF